MMLATSAAFGAAAGAPGVSGLQNRAGTAAAVAGDVIDVTGSNLAPGSATAPGWPLPTTLASTQVFCNSYAAPILSVAPDRVRIQLPWELAGLQTVQVRVVSGGISSDPYSVTMTEFAPAILGTDMPSAAPGQIVTLRVVGMGPRDKNPLTGSGPTSDSPGAAFIHFVVWIGGVPAPVTANGLAAGDPQTDAGVQAVAVQVPFNIAPGDNVPMQVQIGGVLSDAFAIGVQASGMQISLSPGGAQVPLGGSQKFSASVQGSQDQTFKWSLDANAYALPNQGGSYGSIQNGFFTAYYAMTVPNWVIVRATHASGAFATALVQLVAQDKAAYRIVPDSPVIAAGESVSMTLTRADGTAVDGVTWSITDGFSGSNSSTYKAPLSNPPLQVNVFARLPGMSGFLYDVATTAILIDPPRSQITGTIPAVGHVGELLAFQGTGITDRVVYAWFSAADGSRIRSGGQSAIMVPHGAVSGPVWLELNGGTGGADFLSAPYQLTILPRLRLHASRQRVSSGETVRIVAAAPDVPGLWTPTWRADLGSVDSKGMFVAPTVNQPAFARIWACLQQNTECATTVVEVVPLRLEPDPLILNTGETVQLEAWRGSAPAMATWQALTANVTVTPSGKLTVGSGAFDGGLAVVSATAGGVTQFLNISIRTAGAVSNTVEFKDWLGLDNNSPSGRLALGVFSSKAAVNGDWIYALSSSIENYGGPWRTGWLDVYQLDQRKNPVWVDSVEAPYDAGGLYAWGNSLYVAGDVLLRFDISGGRPILQSRQSFNGAASTYQPQGFTFTVPSDPNGVAPVTLQIWDHATGNTRTMNVDYVPIGTYSATANGTATWAAVTFFYPFAFGVNYETVVLDITGTTAEPIAILPSGGFNSSITILQDVLVVGGDVYQVSGKNVTLVSQLQARFVVDSDASTKRLLMEPFFTIQEDGYRVVDLSDPAHPKTSATVDHSEQWTTGKLGPDYFVLLRGPQNIGVYPIQWQPGVRKIDSFPASPWMNDLRARDGYLYWTGPGWGFKGRSESLGIFEIDDISSTPANVVSTMGRPGDQVGWAIELNGHYAYVGTDTELIVYDINSPTAPVQGAVLPAPAISLALLGNYLYAGSNSAKNTVLLVYDVSDAALPQLVNSIALPDFAYGIAAQSGWLAVALGKKGLSVYSLANPATPSLAAHLSGTFWGVAGDRTWLYAAAASQGFFIFDLSNLKNPVVVSQTPLAVGNELSGNSYPTALAVSLDSRGIAWVSSGKEGRVYGLDVRVPGRPRHVAEVTTGAGVTVYSAAATAELNGRLYVAGNDAAFDVVTPQNVGLWEIPQSAPWQVLPDRSNDTPPVAQSEPPLSESLKSRVLHGREDNEQSAVDRRIRRTFRAPRPVGEAGIGIRQR